MPTEEQVYEALEEVIDPELGLDFVSLGLVYDVELESEEVFVTFTLTTPACPIGPQVSEQMREFVGDLDGVAKVHPKMVFDPPWSPDMMSEDAKFALGLLTPRRSGLGWPVAATARPEAVSGTAAFGLQLDVFLRHRGQQRDEHPQPGEDVDDRENLRSSACRMEVSVADRRQRHNREVEGLDDCPVLGSPVEDGPREQQRTRDEGQRPGLGVVHNGGDGPPQ